MLRHVILFGASLSLLSAASAQLASPRQAVDARINRFRELGAAFKSLNDQARAGTIIKMTARLSARTISAAARDQYQWFPAGSGPAPGVKTKAKAAIWANAAAFKQGQAAFQREAEVTARVVEAGDLAAIQKQVKSLGQTCAACHRTFREED